ncbi:FkbM family methyltransferase [Winogradskyella immobilis]|uniref:FkbM family methyltransferase n=1 Tax=Winogradskyella immobilis TaxID=2816852 RepID=A0ABS8ERF9_9FLAO|nr:FkbM family methyltransferase [Winogradskyella immobilis]MCC1484887.1 FkbM family methyltransferase [Winogradskyella immobilis]MCG0016979.1 FkbM family methyltransferase [Winogradskyella immobilis]
MKIKKFLSGIKYKLENKERKLVVSNICGVSIKATPGTIREAVDQDDTWFFYLAKHNDVIFDIGCNVGYTALLAMIQNPQRDYILVDPNPQALNEAHFNLTINNLGLKAQYFSGFVSDNDNSNMKFYTIGSGAAGSMYASHAKSAAATNSFTEVSTVTLDYLYKLYDLKPDIIKIDVEGAETLVMEGAYTVANKTECAFFIEMHNVEGLGMEKAGQLMLDWCDKAKYRAWYLKTGTELKTASTIKDRGKCHLLLLPEDKPYPDYLIGIEQKAALPKTL